MPVAVRNATKTIVVLSNPDGESIEWDYFGAPSGGDFQEISEELWNSSRLRRAKNRGILAEATEEAMDAAYAAQRDHIAATQGSRQDEIARAIEQGAPGTQIIISAEDMDAHVGSKVRDGELLETAMAQAEARSANPMAVVNAAAEME